jgi:hypothetical protein
MKRQSKTFSSLAEAKAYASHLSKNEAKTLNATKTPAGNFRLQWIGTLVRYWDFSKLS